MLIVDSVDRLLINTVDMLLHPIAGCFCSRLFPFLNFFSSICLFMFHLYCGRLQEINSLLVDMKREGDGYLDVNG